MMSCWIVIDFEAGKAYYFSSSYSALAKREELKQEYRSFEDNPHIYIINFIL